METAALSRIKGEAWAQAHAAALACSWALRGELLRERIS